MYQKPFTTVAYQADGTVKTAALNGEWKLGSLQTWVHLRQGDMLNFSFTRHHASGRKQSFTVTEGELNEVTKQHFFSSDVTCK